MTDVTFNGEAWNDLEDGTEGLLDEWLVVVSDTVTKGQLIAQVVLVKTSYEITAPVSGTISTINVAAQENFTQEDVLAVIN